MMKSAANSPTLNTAFLLMAQYGGKAIIPVEEVCRDYFSHLDTAKFIRKVGAGEIEIPMVRMENSQKCAKGIHLQCHASTNHLDLLSIVPTRCRRHGLF